MVRLMLTMPLLVLGLAVAGCQSAPSPDRSECRPEAAESLAGRMRITDAQARELTGASLVRQIRPGEPVTQDYRLERVTVETDPTTNRIIRAMCG